MILAQILIKHSDEISELQQKLFDLIEFHNIQLDSTQIEQINGINELMNKARGLVLKVM
jgi:hypothetical protein